MQSAQRWRGEEGREASLSSLSASVFPWMHVVCDDKYLNVNVFECVYSPRVHEPFCTCWLNAFLLYCTSSVSVPPLIHVVQSTLQVVQMCVYEEFI